MLLLLIALIFTILGAYFIAYNICKYIWKETVSPSRIIVFLAIFILSFGFISFGMGIALLSVFGR